MQNARSILFWSIENIIFNIRDWIWFLLRPYQRLKLSTYIYFLILYSQNTFIQWWEGPYEILVFNWRLVSKNSLNDSLRKAITLTHTLIPPQTQIPWPKQLQSPTPLDYDFTPIGTIKCYLLIIIRQGNTNPNNLGLAVWVNWHLWRKIIKNTKTTE